MKPILVNMEKSEDYLLMLGSKQGRYGAKPKYKQKRGARFGKRPTPYMGFVCP